MFEEYKNMDENELKNKLQSLEIEYQKILDSEKKVERKVRKNLWLWYLFPLFGLLFYNIHLKKRKEKEENFCMLYLEKEKLIYLELEIKFLKTKLEKLQK